MFLAAVARPRFNAAGECTFDGKIGMWPFAELQPAKRSSVNRPRGTMEWKQLSVTMERYRDMLQGDPSNQTEVARPQSQHKNPTGWRIIPYQSR
jgi:hypothetical protein